MTVTFKNLVIFLLLITTVSGCCSGPGAVANKSPFRNVDIWPVGPAKTNDNNQYVFDKSKQSDKLRQHFGVVIVSPIDSLNDLQGKVGVHYSGKFKSYEFPDNFVECTHWLDDEMKKNYQAFTPFSNSIQLLPWGEIVSGPYGSPGYTIIDGPYDQFIEVNCVMLDKTIPAWMPQAIYNKWYNKWFSKSYFNEPIEMLLVSFICKTKTYSMGVFPDEFDARVKKLYSAKAYVADPLICYEQDFNSIKISADWLPNVELYLWKEIQHNNPNSISINPCFNWKTPYVYKGTTNNLNHIDREPKYVNKNESFAAGYSNDQLNEFKRRIGMHNE